MSQYDYDERFEPGFDPGPCRTCGEDCGGECDEREEFLIDGVGFADPGGKSALRAATRRNPRNLPCPTCKAQNVLTAADVRAGYQCDACADRAERGQFWPDGY